MMKNLYLYFLVSISGAAVLALEILGTRILGPYYGVSIFLWSALIAVTLIALSVGYTIGGRWADKVATMRQLSIIISIAGAWIVLIPWIKQPVLLFADPLGLRSAVLFAAFILFAPPLTFLGMVSPYAIKLRTTSLQEVGSSAGNIFAISTIASVVSALLTGYLLIPNIGVKFLTIAIGIVLLLSATIGLATKKNENAKGLIFAVILFLGLVFAFNLSNSTDSKRGLLSVEQSPYSEIRVIDWGNKRHLVMDGGLHTIVDPSNWRSYYRYVAVLGSLKFLFDKPGGLLLIGLGGGSVVKDFAKYGWDVDVVEIDPVVTKIAYKYFGLVPTEANIYHMDGRRFLSTNTGNYDVIILDAYGSSYIPFHLVSKELFALISSKLKPGGILAINIIATGWNDQIIKSLFITIKGSFKEVIVLPTEESRNQLQNFILVASNRKLNIRKGMFENSGEYSGDINMRQLRQRVKVLNRSWDGRFTPDTESTTPLTDDLNPIDVQAEAVNKVLRKNIHEYFGNSGLDW